MARVEKALGLRGLAAAIELREVGGWFSCMYSVQWADRMRGAM